MLPPAVRKEDCQDEGGDLLKVLWPAVHAVHILNMHSASSEKALQIQPGVSCKTFTCEQEEAMGSVSIVLAGHGKLQCGVVDLSQFALEIMRSLNGERGVTASDTILEWALHWFTDWRPEEG